jgi:hypothetical protein
MEQYLHRMVGFYPTRAIIESARDAMLALGFAPQQLRIIAPGSGAAGADGADGAADSDDVLDDLLRDGAIGTAVGAAAGAGVTVALAAANITLFIANPVLGALYLLGWGASLGGLVGAAVGAERSQGDVPSLIKDAMAVGQFVLVAHAKTEAQTVEAQRNLGNAMSAGGLAPGAQAASALASSV